VDHPNNRQGSVHVSDNHPTLEIPPRLQIPNLLIILANQSSKTNKSDWVSQTMQQQLDMLAFGALSS